MSALAYLADCEARNRHVAASEELSELERDGLVIIEDHLRHRAAIF